MGIELRNGRVYYYRKRRKDGRVVSEYMGHGIVAHWTFLQDSEEQRQREQQRLQLAALKEEQRRLDEAVNTYHDAVRKATAEVLKRLGYHRHKRQWRLKRKQDAQMTGKTLETITHPELEERYFALMRAAQGKQKGKAIDEMQEYARAHPQMFDDFRFLKKTTLDVVLEFCSSDEVTRIHLRGEADAMRRRLGSEDALPLEQLLIDDIVHCWLRLMAIEQIYSRTINGGCSSAIVLFLEKRLSLAQRRYHRAIESLARTRGLLVRAGVQVNIAQNQVVLNGDAVDALA